MFLTSINTRVFAESAQAPVTYENQYHQKFYWYGTEDLLLQKENSYFTITVNKDFETEHSVKVGKNTSVTVNGGEHTWKYKNTVNSALNGMFKLSDYGAKLAINSGNFVTASDCYAPIVTGLVAT